MKRLMNAVAVSALLAGLFYGALSISKLDLGYSKALCGPWGCTADTAALLSVHCMWLVLIGGAGTLARLVITKIQPRKGWAIGAAGFALILVMILGYEMAIYLQDGRQFTSALDIPKFLGFHIIQSPDLPIAQLVLVSLAHTIIPWPLRQRSASLASSA